MPRRRSVLESKLFFVRAGLHMRFVLYYGDDYDDDDEYMMMTVIPLVLQVVLASKDLAGRAKGIGRPAEPDFALVGGRH